MKFLRIRVRSDRFNTMLYPAGFDKINCLEHLYCDDLEAGICWLLVLIQDEDLSKITDMTDVTELDVAAATVFAERFEPKTMRITDEAKVRMLEIKSSAGIKLTPAELKALDPDDPTLGIGWNIGFMDKSKKRLGL